MAAGLGRLNRRDLPAAERLAGYRQELESSHELLEASLRANPAQADALARLAAVRWELAPGDPDAVPDELIALASTLSPRNPRVQLRLAQLMVSMGRHDQARRYLARVLELEPSSGKEVVAMLRGQRFAADEILEAVGDSPSVLASLETAVIQDGQEERYRDALWTALARWPEDAELIARFGNVGMRLGRADSLRQELDRLGVREQPRAEAERLRHRSRALLAQGHGEEAAMDAARAFQLMADSPTLAEHLGDVELALGRSVEAIEAFRSALTRVAAGQGPPARRARLYRKIGQAEEARHTSDRAYDAYRMALALDPDEVVASRRVAEMERAAGLGDPIE